MNCAAAISELGCYLDGQVPPASAAGLEAHLAGCAACRERFDREARCEGAVARALCSSPDQARDDAGWERALASTLAPAATPAAPWWALLRQPPSPGQLRWFALVASLVLLATFSMAGLGLRRSAHASASSTPDALPALPGISR